ncbi:MAG: hypothetical protein ABWW69_03880 [Pyrodictiaceae archaeon]
MSIKGFALTPLSLMLALGVLTIILGFFAGHYRGFYLTLVLGGIMTAVLLIYMPLLL